MITPKNITRIIIQSLNKFELEFPFLGPLKPRFAIIIFRIDYILQKNLKKSMELFRNQLVNILYRGIKTINQKIKGINMRKTNKLIFKESINSKYSKRIRECYK